MYYLEKKYDTMEIAVYTTGGNYFNGKNKLFL